MDEAKPRVRWNNDKLVITADSFQNFLTKTGIGTANLSSGGRYGFNPVTRNRLQLEWAYRGSWIVGTIVDCVAEDMTRAGAEFLSDDDPEDTKLVDQTVARLQIWKAIQKVSKWSRLYGGAIGYMMIDGQKSDTPLDIDKVTKGQFKGIMPLDRWALQPDLANLVQDLGPHIGEPEFYTLVRADMGQGPGTVLNQTKIHYTRLFRMVGVELPYWQMITENYWGQSVVERLWDRLVAFDSSTMGVAQLMYKAHLRTYKVEGLRQIIALGGAAMEGLAKQIEMVRAYQSNEGLTLMDTKDEFEVHPYTFTGLDDVLLQFGQQLSGAAQIPLVRLFGQSPAGMNSTGESDLRTYYDGINRQQEDGREGVELAYNLAYRSTHGRPPPDGWSVEFNKLWQMDDEQRANVAVGTTAAIISAVTANVVARSTALKELKQSSDTTGMWTNITDEMIDEAEADDDAKPPSPEELATLAAASKGGDGSDDEGSDGGRGAGGDGPGKKPTGDDATSVRAAA